MQGKPEEKLMKMKLLCLIAMLFMSACAPKTSNSFNGE